MATYQFVMTNDQGEVTVYTDDIEQFCDQMDVDIVGSVENTRARQEFIGCPKIAGYVGPCWGGRTEAGDPIFRYEDRAAHSANCV